MKNENNIKLCYTKKASIIPALISIFLSVLFIIGFSMLPYVAFITEDSVIGKYFWVILAIIVALMIDSLFIRMGIIWPYKIIKQRLKINKVIPKYLCEFNPETKTFIIDIMGEKTVINATEIVDVTKNTNNNATYMFCKIKVEHDFLSELSFVLKKHSVNLPFIKNINKEIQQIKSLIK